jgi:hypothetical protein
LVNDIKKLVSLFACIHKTYTYTCVKAWRYLCDTYIL